ncbi:MAG: IS5/IS1182 family transposase [Anaerolineae bacterium]|nr:IS5/IS1182 family transposase [Anaerolineae bacterium]
MSHPTVQGFQLHPVPTAYGLSVGTVAHRQRSQRRTKKEISYHAVYYHYRKWCRDGSLESVFQDSILSIREQINTHHLNLDGSHAPAKKGGEAVAYQGRKKAKTSNVLPITDANGFILASTGIVAGNHNAAFELKDNIRAAFGFIKRLAIEIGGSYFNADAAFDTKAARKVCFNHRVIPNIVENTRSRKKPKRGRKRLFNRDVYKLRFAWIDKFRALLVRFDRKAAHFMGTHYIAYALINLRHLLAGTKFQ